eukprot:65151_1
MKWYPLITNAICFAICIIFTILVFHHLYQNIEPISKIRSSTKHLSLVCMILFTTTSIILIFTCYLPFDSIQYSICAAFGSAIWFISQTICYLLYINRLYYTFYSTKYQITNHILYQLYITITLFALCHLGMCIVFILEYKTNPSLNYHTAGIFYAILYISLEIVDLILCINVVYVFASRLIQLICDFNEEEPIHKKHVCHLSISINKKSYIYLNAIQRFMVKVMTQYFLLTTVSNIATQIFLLVRAIAEIFYFYDITSDYGHLWTISLVLQGIHCCISVITVYLMFEFGNTLYYTCCGKMDRYCTLWCKNIAKYKATQIYELSVKHQNSVHNEYVLIEQDEFER